jgi:putative NADH-flavin reductase
VKILILGASRGTGALAAKVAVSRGHDVTAFARSPEKLDLASPRLTRVTGDFHSRESVAAAVPGHDAVIMTASASGPSGFKKNPTYFSSGTEFAIDAMKASGVRRLVVLSALGTGDSRPLMPVLVQKLVLDWILKPAFADHDRQEAMVRQSGLDWVIARPGRLTNGQGRGRYVAKDAIAKVPMSIARADVADFLVTATETEKWLRKAVQLGG